MFRFAAVFIALLACTHPNYASNLHGASHDPITSVSSGGYGHAGISGGHHTASATPLVSSYSFSIVHPDSPIAHPSFQGYNRHNTHQQHFSAPVTHHIHSSPSSSGGHLVSGPVTHHIHTSPLTSGGNLVSGPVTHHIHSSPSASGGHLVSGPVTHHIHSSPSASGGHLVNGPVTHHTYSTSSASGGHLVSSPVTHHIHSSPLASGGHSVSGYNGANRNSYAVTSSYTGPLATSGLNVHGQNGGHTNLYAPQQQSYTTSFAAPSHSAVHNGQYFASSNAYGGQLAQGSQSGYLSRW